MTTADRSPVHIIVGAGQAGAHAANSMRSAGFTGRILLVGDESEYPYDRTPLSKALLTGHNGGDLTHFFRSQVYSDADIEMHLGTRVEAIDAEAQRLHLSAGTPMAYDKLLLATGSQPNGLDIPGGERILRLRTIGDAQLLRSQLLPGRRLVCIGGGVIGLELAAAARVKGCAASVVEIGSSVMARSLHPDIAAHVANRHRQEGVTFLFNSEVIAVEPDAVVLGNGDRLAADIVVAGVGVRRNSALAASAGIATDRGIITDEYGRTSIKGIFAAGEVAEYFSKRAGGHVVLESWRHAQDHGAHVGRILAGADEAYDEVPWFWSDQHGHNLQVAGSALAAERLVYRGNPDADTFSVFLLDPDSRIAGAFGFNAGRDVSAAIRLMRRGGRLDPDVLADTGVTAQRLVTTAPITEEI